MFGWDFVCGCMIFIVFLQRVIVKCRPDAGRALRCAVLIVIFAVAVNASLKGFIATAELLRKGLFLPFSSISPLRSSSGRRTGKSVDSWWSVLCYTKAPSNYSCSGRRRSC